MSSLLLFFGKKIIIRKLEAVTRQKVSLQFFSYRPLLNFTLRKLAIGSFFSAESVYVKLRASDLWGKKFLAKELVIVNPVFVFERLNIKSSQAYPALPFSLPANHILIKNAQVDFRDRVVLEKGLNLKLQEMNVEIMDAGNILSQGITQFRAEAKFIFPQANTGSLLTECWLDWENKNLNAKLTIDGLDAMYLYPYYSQGLDLGKAQFEKAAVNFSSKIYALSNDLKADCRLQLVQYSFLPSEKREISREEKTARLALEIFKNLDHGKVFLDFSLVTKMDKPQLDFLAISKAFEEKINRGIKVETIKLEDTVILPEKIIKGTVKSVSEIYKSVFGSALDWGKEFKQNVIDTFVKVKPIDNPSDKVPEVGR